MNESSDLDIDILLVHFFKSTYRVCNYEQEDEVILQECIQLFKKDYKLQMISNKNGELCSHYPSQIIMLEYLLSGENSLNINNIESLYDIDKIQSLINKAKFARCRSRFPIPIILVKDKHICRGATLSGGPEIYGRQIFDLFSSNSESITQSNSEQNDWQMFTRVRGQDIDLLKYLNVGIIFDLMVEKKKVKFGLNVTSSEKVDKENRYNEFIVSSIPYPGCEFFKEWNDNQRSLDTLLFDWNQVFVNASIDLPISPGPPQNINWDDYKTWNLVTLTQNYLKLLLHYINCFDKGMLIHCISGWDRTPLFVSLLRLSLWAEGVIHPSLTSNQILYLTIAYDWFLFGHDLSDRMQKGQEIFCFCFKFLQHITGSEYNLKTMIENEDVDYPPQHDETRTKKLLEVRQLFLEAFDNAQAINNIREADQKSTLSTWTSYGSSAISSLAFKVINA